MFISKRKYKAKQDEFLALLSEREEDIVKAKHSINNLNKTIKMLEEANDTLSEQNRLLQERLDVFEAEKRKRSENARAAALKRHHKVSNEHKNMREKYYEIPKFAQQVED